MVSCVYTLQIYFLLSQTLESFAIVRLHISFQQRSFFTLNKSLKIHLSSSLTFRVNLYIPVSQSFLSLPCRFWAVIFNLSIPCRKRERFVRAKCLAVLYHQPPRSPFRHGLPTRLCNLTANTQLISVSRFCLLRTFRSQPGVAKRFRSRRLALF